MKTSTFWLGWMAALALLLGTLNAAALERITVTVDGVTREALIHLPARPDTNGSPVVFVFHGHGGSMRNAARSFALERHWPEAIVVYPQGLPTPGLLTDPEGRQAGWQAAPRLQGDRDLKFFDALLARIKTDHTVDRRRIYATGHSNGGGFTYLLWAERGETFAAVAPSAAVARYVQRLKPKPALHLAGEKDGLVKFSWQEKMMQAVRTLNGCAATGQPWADKATLYPSPAGTPLVTFIHPGGHEFPVAGSALIVKFFQAHPAAP
jgi:polyhydroxybutyrate depolymerase